MRDRARPIAVHVALSLSDCGGVLRRCVAAMTLLATGLFSGCVRSGDVMMPIPLVPIVALNSAFTQIGSHVATYGKWPSPVAGAFVVGASDRFGKTELKEFYEQLNSSKFQAVLARKFLGVPTPIFKFRVTLHRHFNTGSGARRVDVDYGPELKGLNKSDVFVKVSEAVQKLYNRIEPDPAFRWGEEKSKP